MTNPNKFEITRGKENLSFINTEKGLLIQWTKVAESGSEADDQHDALIVPFTEEERTAFNKFILEGRK